MYIYIYIYIYIHVVLFFCQLSRRSGGATSPRLALGSEGRKCTRAGIEECIHVCMQLLLQGNAVCICTYVMNTCMHIYVCCI